MATMWYCKVGPEEVGPMSASQLRTLVNSGGVIPTTFVRKEGSDWVAASHIKGLFDEVPRSHAAHHASRSHPPSSRRQSHDDRSDTIVEFLGTTDPQTKLFRGGIAAGGAILLGLIATLIAPWMTLLTIMGLFGAGAAYAFAPPFRNRVKERFPSLTSHPKIRRVLGGAGCFLILLVGSSIMMIRHNWKRQLHEKLVADSIHRAEFSLGLGEVDEASDILQRLEADREIRDRSQTDKLKQQIEGAIKQRTVNRANERIVLLELEGRQALQEQRPDRAEHALREAFRQKDATELGPAKQLADQIVKAKIDAAKKLIATDDLKGAKTLAFEAEQLPGADKSLLSNLHVQIANRTVAAQVAVAAGLLKENHLEEAERQLKESLTVRNATELSSANSLLRKIQFEKTKDVVDSSNLAAFASKRGLVRIGAHDINAAEQTGFTFAKYPKSCLTTIDKLINDRAQTINVPFNRGVEVELRFQPMELAHEKSETGGSRFEIVPDPRELPDRTGPRAANVPSWNIEGKRAIAYFVPSDYVPVDGGNVKLELILETPSGKLLTKTWIFEVRRMARGLTEF